ncbi:MAG: TIGR00341 family protein [Gammaproteobacteria bacterium]|nr:TIGR00341 family protein [Gammaproteobacteria bacterium]
MRVIEVITDHGHVDTLRGIAAQQEVMDIWVGHNDEDGRCSTRLLVRPEKQQAVMDALQSLLATADNTRILVLPVEAALPRLEDDELDNEKQNSITRSREELYQKIVSGAKLDSNFMYMVIMSTIVAAIGLLEDNVAVVIGAMVIAPLLGPNMALAFATTLGEGKLLWSALKSNLAGLFTALGLSILIGLLWPLNFDSHELMTRTDVGMDGIVLALVSGAAAVLSLTAGWSNSLVGVMVAVAILPPTATVGLMLGSGNYQHALGAALLLAVNIVCVNLASNIAFLLKGVKPRTWYEKKKAKQSLIVFVLFWLIVLAVLVTAVKVRHQYLLVG